MKITFTVDTSDIRLYDCGSNLEDLLRKLLLGGVLEAKEIYLERRGGESPAVHEATMDAFEQREKLVRRMLDSMEINFEEDKT